MKLIYNKIFLEHETGTHPENKARLLAFQGIEETPLSEIPNGEQFLRLVHGRRHIRRVQEASVNEIPFDLDTLASIGSYEAAYYAVGATLKAAQQGDFALVRPPGHHATADKAMGFCLFNNMAVVAAYLKKQGKRVAILDIDGHFGNGTYDIFEKNKDVFYFSCHEFPNFPGSGDTEDIGKGKAKGTKISMPLPYDSGDDIFLDSIKTALPFIKEFNPDIIGISAGFDGHHADPLLSLRYSAIGYHEVGKLLKEEFTSQGIPVFATLEGGYNVEYLPRCANNFVAGINGQTASYQEASTISATNIKEMYEARKQEVLKRLKS
ncbi:histone deacetylase [Candidatus Woesearchaeota archaeon]|jgi:acetoin utilization deacetylase AcuC-like enzyme|nr:histone deacetylase [Candidatus Woesearchaeota archaeon]MBT5272621.1 histone deacetylase [Candidatus Woesearchaeota archaeon]MBT6041742.1 histone deacetylase [Candidatus Woesearchaeota archaeon]MBT6337173.1 histone deacetylase [Candidatus Woesearchaeota archaeon]MBT7927807.1 histone deacetylase [Candidatus Woesearchaeota archaeon]